MFLLQDVIVNHKRVEKGAALQAELMEKKLYDYNE